MNLRKILLSCSQTFWTMRNLIFLLVVVCLGCTKQRDQTATGSSQKNTDQASQQIAQVSTVFKKFTIQKGAHYSDQNGIVHVSGTSMNFVAKFDSTAIYPAVI